MDIHENVVEPRPKASEVHVSAASSDSFRPRSFYRRGWDYFGLTAESYHRLFPVGRVVRGLDVLGRTPGQLAMYIWHAMFGEELRLPRRQRDAPRRAFGEGKTAGRGH